MLRSMPHHRNLWLPLLFLFVTSCTATPQRKVWTEEGQIHTTEGPYFVKGVCYHPVPIGKAERSFETLTQDLALMNDMGINTIRVYEPIASEAVLDEIHAAGISVIVSIGYNQGGLYDLQSGTYLDYVQRFKSHPAICFGNSGTNTTSIPSGLGDPWTSGTRPYATLLRPFKPPTPTTLCPRPTANLPDEELIASMTDIDLWGLNVYRWDVSYTAAVDFAKLSNKPMYFSEIGADSYMSTSMLGYEQGSNQRAQADATQALLEPLFSDSVRCAGAAIFSFTDGWWKAGQADVQDVGGVAPASSGVPYDADANEEHWGLVDIHRTPKEAYHVVKSIFQSNNASGMKDNAFSTKVFETLATAAGFHEVDQTKVDSWGETQPEDLRIRVNASERKQRIEGFGGSFTDASAYLVHQLSDAQRAKIMEAYFAEDGANYSLTRTHMNSCDFSRFHYSYTPVEGDMDLEHFSIDQDLEFLFDDSHGAGHLEGRLPRHRLPVDYSAWMKDNDWVGGCLLKEMQPTWAQFFVKYAEACKAHDIPLWGFTPENEPHGNGDNWESMLYSPDEMTEFVRDHLGPALEQGGLGDLKILGYDQNRAGLDEWTASMYRDEESAKYFAGTAIHWYESTYEVFGDDLDRAHDMAPDKLLIETEGCIDAEVPVWQDDDWYWQKEATDWGFTWREAEKKYLHPKYSPQCTATHETSSAVSTIGWPAGSIGTWCLTVKVARTGSRTGASRRSSWTRSKTRCTSRRSMT